MEMLGRDQTTPMHSLVSTLVTERLRKAGLRPTRQRVALATLLFGEGHRHVTAEELHAEAQDTCLSVSLATVYNTLNQFTEAGLLREVAIEGQRSYFDTNTSNHFHFYVEDERRLIDIPGEDIQVYGLPELPEGTRIRSIDVIVRLEDSGEAGSTAR
jgi:Fur family transcriptional regulator, iron response regulator